MEADTCTRAPTAPGTGACSRAPPITQAGQWSQISGVHTENCPKKSRHSWAPPPAAPPPSGAHRHVCRQASMSGFQEQRELPARPREAAYGGVPPASAPPRESPKSAT